MERNFDVALWGGTIVLGAVALGACASGQGVAPSSPAPGVTSAASADPVSPAAPGGDSSSAPASEATASPAPSSSAASAPAPDRSLNDIRAVVAQNREAFRGCYDRSAQAHPGIKGTFTLKFVLAPDGSVKTAEADPSKSQIHTADLETCAVGVLRGLKFPTSRRGMESTVSYPFDFNPKAAGSRAVGANPP